MPFSEFLGNTRVITALRGMLDSGRVPHAMLFAGPHGIGKFTLARMFAQAANCERLTGDFCGECHACLQISQLADTSPLIERGLAERGESADAAAVERTPLILSPHPDVWALVPDPVRLKSPVARPVLHVGQLRAVQRAAYFKPEAKRRVFILDGAETMRWDHANIFLKILEEPPETATLILLATNFHALLPTIRSRCLQFFFTPLAAAQVEEILEKRADMTGAQRKLAAQLSEGRAGVAMATNVEEAVELRRSVLAVLASATQSTSAADLFAQTERLAKGQKVPFESILELFYSLLTDLLELSAGCRNPVLRNPILGKELAALSDRLDPSWVPRAVRALDELEGRLRRNINRQLGLDAVALSLSGPHTADSQFD
jgi:DNA polymerase-3 subunit delta'